MPKFGGFKNPSVMGKKVQRPPSILDKLKNPIKGK
jgi:hypothetical protein